MILDRHERKLLVDTTSWREGALPARRGARLRGLVAAILTMVLLYPLLPFGPETAGNCQILLEPRGSDSTVSPVLSANRSLHMLAMEWLSPSSAVAVLTMLMMGTCCGFAVCWLRQLDASRSLVIPVVLMMGVGQGFTDIARSGGAVPSLMMLGLILLVVTEQLRAHAGRGVPLWGAMVGLCLAAGPVTLPALTYSFLSLIFDRGNRASSLRFLPSAVIGTLVGACALWSLASISDSGGFLAAIFGSVESWTPVMNPDFSASFQDLAALASGNGWVIALLAIPGIFVAARRRPGDLALILTLASCGPLLGPLFLLPTITDPNQLAPSHGTIIYTHATMVLLGAWSLTALHRSIGRNSQRSRTLLMITLVLAAIAVLWGRQPGLDRPRANIVTQWARSVLHSVPPDTMVVTAGSPLGTALTVIQRQESLRPDVTILDRSGKIDPTSLGLPRDTTTAQTSTAIHALVQAGRPLLALPLALQSPILRGELLEPWGILLKVSKQRFAEGDSLPGEIRDDAAAWRQLSIPDLPVDPQQAWSWIRGEGTGPYSSGRLAAQIAAAYWNGARRHRQEMVKDRRWDPVMALLGLLINDPQAARRWALSQPRDLPGIAPKPR